MAAWLRAAFSGFSALPPPNAGPSWRDVFAKYGFPRIINAEALDGAYRKAAQAAHPDKSGHHDAMAELNAARDQVRRELAEA